MPALSFGPVCSFLLNYFQDLKNIQHRLLFFFFCWTSIKLTVSFHLKAKVYEHVRIYVGYQLKAGKNNIFEVTANLMLNAFILFESKKFFSCPRIERKLFWAVGDKQRRSSLVTTYHAKSLPESEPHGWFHTARLRLLAEEPGSMRGDLSGLDSSLWP